MIELLKKEFINGRTKREWLFLAVGLILQVIGIYAAYKSNDPYIIVTAISSITGVISVVLAAQGKISNYIFALIQVLTYIFAVVIPNALWGELIENMYYVIFNIVGIFIWLRLYKEHKSNKEVAVKGKVLKLPGLIINGIIFIVLVILGNYFLQNCHIWFPMFFNQADPQPLLDSITTIAPLMGTVLMSMGYREQWILWLIEDTISLVLFAKLGNALMISQYTFWTINCLYGWYNWTKLSKED